MKQILLFAPASDAHARVVARHLDGRCELAQLDLATATDAEVEIRPGEYVAVNDDIVASRGTTVWWRRSGSVPARSDMGAEENRLRSEETTALLIGGLLSLDVRWVDQPGVVQVAEHTLLQLAAARACGALTPATVATNMPVVAARMAESSRLIAKATSPGVGIAPFADHVDETLLRFLPNALTLLQSYTPGIADLRVVVVGDRAYTWRRARQSGEPLDWRDPDPAGAAFTPVNQNPRLEQIAVAITARLGLSFSAQDWVETTNGIVFLEANPVGQWLFLNQADAIVAAALAHHLLSGAPDA